MISANILKELILEKVSNLSETEITDPLSVHNAYAEAITEHISDNLVINGVYAGMTTTTPPVVDPLSGSYSWGVSNVVLAGPALYASVTGQTDPSMAFVAWKTAIQVGIKTTTFAGQDKTSMVSITPVILAQFTLQMDQDMIILGNFDTVVGIIATKIVDSIKSTIVSSMVSVGTTLTPGTGTVTFINLE
jgi:hypothetical protein